MSKIGELVHEWYVWCGTPYDGSDLKWTSLSITELKRDGTIFGGNNSTKNIAN